MRRLRVFFERPSLVGPLTVTDCTAIRVGRVEAGPMVSHRLSTEGGMNNRNLQDDGQDKPIRQWLAVCKMELADPSEVSEHELDIVMGYDEFWEWTNDKKLA